MDDAKNMLRARIVGVVSNGDIGLDLCVLLLEERMERLNSLVGHGVVVNELKETKYYVRGEALEEVYCWRAVVAG